MPLARILIAALAAFALIAAACGDDGGTPEPTATFPPGFTPLPEGFLTPQPPPPLDPNVTLQRFQGEKWPYNIGYPEDWTPNVDGPSIDEFRYILPDGRRAELHVRCTRSIGEGGAEPAALARDDETLISTVSYQASDASAVTINGRDAVKWDYSVAIPGTPARSWVYVYYIKGEGEDPACSWRVSLQALGTEPLTGYQELLDRIVQEFEPGSAG